MQVIKEPNHGKICALRNIGITGYRSPPSESRDHGISEFRHVLGGAGKDYFWISRYFSRPSFKTFIALLVFSSLRTNAILASFLPSPGVE